MGCQCGGHCQLDTELLEAEDQLCSPCTLPRPSISVPSWFSRAAVTKGHKLGSLKLQKLVISHFWSLQVQNQGANRAPVVRQFFARSVPASAIFCKTLGVLVLQVQPFSRCLLCHMAFSPPITLSLPLLFF